MQNLGSSGGWRVALGCGMPNQKGYTQIVPPSAQGHFGLNVNAPRNKRTRQPTRDEIISGLQMGPASDELARCNLLPMTQEEIGNAGMDIGLKFLPEGPPQYFVNEVERSPTTSLWFSCNPSNTMGTMADTFAMVFRQWIKDIRNPYINLVGVLFDIHAIQHVPHMFEMRSNTMHIMVFGRVQAPWKTEHGKISVSNRVRSCSNTKQGDGPKYTCFLKHIMVFERDRTRYLRVERCSIVFKHHARRWPKVHLLPKEIPVFDRVRTALNGTCNSFHSILRCSNTIEHGTAVSNGVRSCSNTMKRDSANGQMCFKGNVPAFIALIQIGYTSIFSYRKFDCIATNLLLSTHHHHIAMSDYYWPRSVPSELHRDYIFQVRYSMKETDDGDVSEIVVRNLHDAVPMDQHHVFFPKFYDRLLRMTLWTYYLYINLYERFRRRRQKKFKSFFPHLLKCIVHLDNNFNEYLITDFLLGRHDPDTLNMFRSRCPINIERMSFADFDFDKYKDNMSKKMCGEEFDFDISKIDGDEWEPLWDEVQDWHKKKPDIAWISSWVQWDDGTGRVIQPTRNKTTEEGGNDGDEGMDYEMGSRSHGGTPEEGGSGHSGGSGTVAMGFDPTLNT
ncbi:hypothetical protein EDD15DRAFT_2193943 [Pisolithus albus]|nr:hypothetical protein EDD15DRAFT_2193943 [Pisolithus albus]